MIKYNAKTINDWYYGISDLVKVYKGGAVCYYKVSGTPPSPTSQTPCFAVVDNISQYSDTEFEDVFNNADGKWYKLNNLNQYEEYGVYGSGRTITTYEGKLTIDEYTQPSRLPSGYTEVEYIENSSYVANTLSTTRFNVIGDSASGNIYTIIYDMEDDGGSHYIDVFGNNVNIIMQKIQQVWADKCIHFKYYGLDVYVESTPLSTKAIIEMDSSGVTVTNITASTSTTNTYGGSLSNVNETHYGVFCFYNTSDRGAHSMVGKIYEIKIESSTHELKNHYIPCYRNSDNKVGLYDIVGGAFYYDESNELTLSAGSSITPTTTTCEFIYSGNSWSNLGEVSGSTASLPNKSFVLNYNAKDYDDTTHSIPYTSGQSKAVNAIQNYGTNTIVDHSSDGYISITGNTRLTISGGTTSLARNNSQTGCTMTVVSKALTRNNYSLFTCRGLAGVNTLCWMYRQYSDYLLLCGKSNAPTLSCSSSDPSVLSIKTYYNNGVSSTVKNWSDNTTTSGSYEYYNNYDNGALFCDYLGNNDEFWQGDFYWVYMSQEVLTDEEIQQVIAYNEGSGGTPTYPMYYAEMQDPPNNVSFSSMTEAEEYECPWWGMSADIDNTDYLFCETNQWLTKYVYQEVSGDYICDGGNKYKKMQEYDRNVDGSTSATTNYVIGDLIESASTDCSSRLPSGYTEVEYIENPSMAYINSGFKPNQDTRILFTFKFEKSQSASMLIGAGGWDRADGMLFDYEQNLTGTLHISWGGTTRWSVVSSVHGDYNVHTYDWNKNEFYLDNTLVDSTTYRTFQCSDNLGIFSPIQYPYSPFGQQHFACGRLYDFKIYDNGTLVRDFVPCTNPNDVAGLYDIVNGVFYDSAYSGYNFIAGQAV